MAATASFKKTQTLSELLITSFIVIKKNLANLLLTIFIVTCIIIAAILFLFAFYYLFILIGVTKINFIFTYNLLWKTTSSIVYFLIAVIAQILLINVFFQPKIDFKENLKSIKKYFWNFLCLTIVLHLLFLFFTLPIYVGITLLALNNAILGLLSFFLGIFLALFLVSYLVFSPFILIDKNTRCMEAIRKSIKLSQGYLANIILKILFLTIILVILNILSGYLVPFYTQGKLFYIIGLLGIVIVLIMILLTFAYLYNMYQNYKSLKNVK